MNKEEVFDKICKFEEDYGESFFDYFTHDNVNDSSWAFWLLGKGFNEKANQIIQLILEGEECIDQDILYEVYSSDTLEEDVWNEEIWNKNMKLQAEFLCSTPYYLAKVEHFFNERGL